MDEPVAKGVILLPEEYLKKIIEDPPRRHANALLDAFYALPQVLLSFLQTVPMPWEENKKIACIYNTDGAILQIKGTCTEDSINYRCNWLSYVLSVAEGSQYVRNRKKWSVNEYLDLKSRFSAEHPLDTRHPHTSQSLFPMVHQTNRLKDKALLEIKNNPAETDRTHKNRKVLQRENMSVIINESRKGNKRKTKKTNLKSGTDKNKGVLGDPQTPKTRSKQTRTRVKKEFKSIVEWSRAGEYISNLGARALNYVLENKRTRYLKVTKSFELVERRAPTTKERKKGRLGESFHLLLEILKLHARILQIFVRCRTEQTPEKQKSLQLAGELSHVGISTGIYRHKYSAVSQIAETKRIAKMLSQKTTAVAKQPLSDLFCHKNGQDINSRRFSGKQAQRIPPGRSHIDPCNENEEGLTLSLFWCEPWKIWVRFLRGVAPLLENRLKAYVIRRREGREKRPKKVTAQRIESRRDVDIKNEILQEIKEAEGEEAAKKYGKRALHELQAAWRHWKSDTKHAARLPDAISKIVAAKIEKKTKTWIEEASKEWMLVKQIKQTDKKRIKKAEGKILQVHMKIERRREKEEAEFELFSTQAQKAARKDALSRAIFESRSALEQISRKIPRKLSLKLYSREVLQQILSNSITNLENRYKIRSNVKKREKQEMDYLASKKKDLSVALALVLESVQKKREFRAYSVALRETAPVYAAPVEEALVDAFLDALFWHFANEARLFPSWIVPLDSAPLPVSFMRVGKSVAAWTEEFANRDSDLLHFASLEYSALVEEADFLLLKDLLLLAFDDTLVDYVLARLKVSVEHKSMSYVKRAGLFEGLGFYPFLSTYYLLCVDVNLLGAPDLEEFESSNAMFFYDPYLFSKKYGTIICGYFRCGTEAYVLYSEKIEDTISTQSSSLKHSNQRDLSHPTPCAAPDPFLEEIKKHPHMLLSSSGGGGGGICSDRGVGAHGIGYLVNSHHHLDDEIDQHLNPSISNNHPSHPANFPPQTAHRSTLPPWILSRIALFTRKSLPEISSKQEIASLPTTLRFAPFDLTIDEGSYRLSSSYIEVQRFRRGIEAVIQESISANFFSISERWNRLVLRAVCFFRETLSPLFLEEIKKSEEKIKKRIMAITNSKAKKRFPDFLFYSEKSAGGLGLVSPTALRQSVPHWRSEIEKSEEIYSKIASYVSAAQETSTDPALFALTSLERQGVPIDRVGIPRASTFLKKHPLKLPEKRWRLKYYIETNKRKWTEKSYDGNWLDWAEYRKHLNTPPPEELFAYSLYPIAQMQWRHASSKIPQDSQADTPFGEASIIAHVKEPRKKPHKRAQREELRRLPNKMFMFWWSPVVNRESLEIGRKAKIEETNVSIWGKLKSLRPLYQKLFSGLLWRKAHEEITRGVFQILERSLLRTSFSSLRLYDAASHQPSHYSAEYADPSLLDQEDGRKYLASTTPSILLYSSRSDSGTPAWITVRVRWSHAETQSLRDEAETWGSAMIACSGTPPTRHSVNGCVVLVDLRDCAYEVYSTSADLEVAKDILADELKYTLRSLRATLTLQKRVRFLTGFAERVGAEREDGEDEGDDPKKIFSGKGAVYLQLEKNAIYGVEVRTGAYFQISKASEGIDAIVGRVFGAVAGLSNVSAIYSEENLYRILARSGKPYLFVKSKFSVNISLLGGAKIENVYKAWRGAKEDGDRCGSTLPEGDPTCSAPAILHPYTYFCRLSLILRHAETVDRSSLRLIGEPHTDTAWISLENRMAMDLCRYHGNLLQIGENLLIDRKKAQEAIKNAVYRKNPGELPFKKSARRTATEWVSLTDWRERYPVAGRMPCPLSAEERVSQKKPSSTICMSAEILRAVFRMSDPLVPVTSFVIRKENAYLLVTPAQFYHAQNFNVMLDKSAVKEETITGVIETVTYFSKQIEPTYSWLPLSPSILRVRIDLTSGAVSSAICEVSVQGAHRALVVKQQCATIFEDAPSFFFSDAFWNRNMEHSADAPRLLPDRPAPFYSDIFRPSHFQR